MARSKKGRKSVQTKAKANKRVSHPADKPKKKVAKEKLSKRQIVDQLATTLADSGHIPDNVSAKKIVTQVLDDLTGLIESCMNPKGIGQFMLPGVVKFTTREKPAIKKGTMVRRPGTSEMMPSKGRPASIRVKAAPLARVKKAAQK